MSTPPGKWVISLLSQHHRTSVPVTLTSLTNGPGMPEWWYQASRFLEFCVAVFAFEVAVTSSILHHLQGKKYLPSALLGSEAFSDLLWTHALAPSCDGIRKLVSLSLAFSAPGWGLTALFVFPKVVLQPKFVVSRSCRVGPAFHVYSQGIFQSSLLLEWMFIQVVPPLTARARCWPQGGCECGWGTEVVQLPVGQWGDPQVGLSQRPHWSTFGWSPPSS